MLLLFNNLKLFLLHLTHIFMFVKNKSNFKTSNEDMACSWPLGYK